MMGDVVIAELIDTVDKHLTFKVFLFLVLAASAY